MKILLTTLVTAVLATSCVTIQKSMYVSSSSAVDYQQYADKDFFLTESNSVNFDYKPVSSVMSISRSGYVDVEKSKAQINESTEDQREQKSKLRDDRLPSKQGLGSKSSFRRASSDDALKELYTKAVALGANGIINLKIETYTEKGTNSMGQTIDLVGFSATGMAIKK